jgi:hypothetical protein
MESGFESLLPSSHISLIFSDNRPFCLSVLIPYFQRLSVNIGTNLAHGTCSIFFRNRASDYESEGRGFKSLRAYQLFPENQQVRGVLNSIGFLYFPLFSIPIWHKNGTWVKSVSTSGS